jgi:hypothetical protein
MIEGWAEFRIPQLTIIRQLKAATVDSLAYSAPPDGKTLSLYRFHIFVRGVGSSTWSTPGFFENEEKPEVVRYEDLVSNNERQFVNSTKLGLALTKSAVDYLRTLPLVEQQFQRRLPING